MVKYDCVDVGMMQKRLRSSMPRILVETSERREERYNNLPQASQ